MSVLFLLGAGASVDSGLKTFRGVGKHYNNYDEIEEDVHVLNKAGPTYQKISEICQQYENVMIVTQNLDGLIFKVYTRNAIIIELHGNLKSPVMLGDTIDAKLYTQIEKFIKQHHPEKCFVVGTTLQFSYLHDIITKVSQRNGQIIHVNPDPDYNWHLYRHATRHGRETLKKRKRPHIKINKLDDLF